MHVSTNRAVAHLRGERGNQVDRVSERAQTRQYVCDGSGCPRPTGARLSVRLDKTAGSRKYVIARRGALGEGVRERKIDVAFQPVSSCSMQNSPPSRCNSRSAIATICVLGVVLTSCSRGGTDRAFMPSGRNGEKDFPSGKRHLMWEQQVGKLGLILPTVCLLILHQLVIIL